MSNATTLPHDSAAWLDQAKQRLNEFFQNKYVKTLIPILVPGTLAAALLPVFGPVAAGTAAAAAIKSAFALLKIEMSIETIEKLLRPIEGKQLTDDDMQEALTDALKALLPTDKKVNEEAAKALITFIPSIKEAVLGNSRLDAQWLGESLETNLKEQGEVMAKIAPDIHAIMLKDPQAFASDVQRLLQNWSRITVEVRARSESEISDVESRAKTTGGSIGHIVEAEDNSTIKGIKIDSEIL